MSLLDPLDRYCCSKPAEPQERQAAISLPAADGWPDQRGAGAILTTSALGPFFGDGLVQWISPLRLAAAVAALESVMLSFS